MRYSRNAQIQTVKILIVCVVSLISGCSMFSFRLGEISMDWRKSEVKIGVEEPLLNSIR